MASSVVTPTTFYDLLCDFVSSLSARFPANDGAKAALTGLQLFGSPAMHPKMSKMWYDLSAPIIQDIIKRDPGPVVQALDNCDVAVISGIGAGAMLQNPDVDEATKESIWGYLDNLTAAACAIENPQHVPMAVQTPVAAPAPMAPPAHPVIAPGGAPMSEPPQKSKPANPTPPAKPAVKDVIKGITSSLPDIIDGLNDVLKTNGMEGENPIMDMVKQMINPNAMQPGLANNAMALAMGQGNDGSPMEQAAAATGMSAEDIQSKLARLELFEKARAKRKQSRGD